jgi:hypothetical protein
MQEEKLGRTVEEEKKKDEIHTIERHNDKTLITSKIFFQNKNEQETNPNVHCLIGMKEDNK